MTRVARAAAKRTIALRRTDLRRDTAGEGGRFFRTFPKNHLVGCVFFNLIFVFLFLQDKFHWRDGIFYLFPISRCPMTSGCSVSLEGVP